MRQLWINTVSDQGVPFGWVEMGQFFPPTDIKTINDRLVGFALSGMKGYYYISNVSGQSVTSGYGFFYLDKGKAIILQHRNNDWDSGLATT